MIRVTTFIFCGLLSIALSQSDCASRYGQYLNAIKGNLDQDYPGLETEFGGDYRKLVLGCFVTEACHTDKACYITGDDLDAAFTDAGPLKGCAICLTIARIVKNLFLQAPSNVLTCIRGVLAKAIGLEIGTCVKQQRTNFVMPDIPDFDEKSDCCRNQTVNDIGMYAAADGRLKFCAARPDSPPPPCRTRRSATTAAVTQTCIAARKLPDSTLIWQKACGHMKANRAGFGSCLDDFQQVEKLGCGCIESKRQEIQQKITDAAAQFDKIVAATAPGSDDGTCKTTGPCNPTTDTNSYCADPLVAWKTCQCVATAQKLIDDNSGASGEHPSLRKVFADIVGCSPDPDTQKQFQLDNLVTTVCFRISREGQAGAKGSSDLKTAVNFMKSVFDGIVVRVQRFCPGPHCPGVGNQ
jgi:hypothetical protein